MTPPETDPPGPAQRQPKETAVAFEAFRHYLEAGPARSTAKVARALGKSKTLIDRWSSRNRWVERVREFEAEAIAAVDVAHMDAIARRSRRQAEIAELHGEATALVPAEILKRAQNPEFLAGLTVAELLQLEATLGRMHGRAVVAERLALGLHTSQGADPVPRSTADEIARRMSDAELNAALAGVDQLAVARERRKRRKAG